MSKRIVIALGGNALGNNLPEQMQAVKHTARAIVGLIEQGNAVVVAILTAVEKVAVNFGKPDQQWLDELTPETAARYIAEGQFAPGSAQSGEGRSSLITLLDRAADGIAGKTGNIVRG